MSKNFLGFENTKINDEERVTFDEVVRNPVFWAAGLGLWMITTMGMMSFMVMTAMNASGVSILGTVLLYSLAYITAAVALGASVYYFSHKYGYRINYQTSLIPFVVIVGGGLILLAFGGFLIGAIYIYSILGGVLLIIPYSVGYVAAAWEPKAPKEEDEERLTFSEWESKLARKETQDEESLPRIEKLPDEEIEEVVETSGTSIQELIVEEGPVEEKSFNLKGATVVEFDTEQIEELEMALDADLLADSEVETVEVDSVEGLDEVEATMKEKSEDRAQIVEVDEVVTEALENDERSAPSSKQRRQEIENLLNSSAHVSVEEVLAKFAK